jgi:hypothetical protein
MDYSKVLSAVQAFIDCVYLYVSSTSCWMVLGVVVPGATVDFKVSKLCDYPVSDFLMIFIVKDPLGNPSRDPPGNSPGHDPPV